eukprot:2452952-Prymnesium_polylepis.2
MPDASSAAVGVAVGGPGAAATREAGAAPPGAAHASQPSTPPEPSTSTGLRSPPDGNAAEHEARARGLEHRTEVGSEAAPAGPPRAGAQACTERYAVAGLTRTAGAVSDTGPLWRTHKGGARSYPQAVGRQLRPCPRASPSAHIPFIPHKSTIVTSRPSHSFPDPPPNQQSKQVNFAAKQGS